MSVAFSEGRYAEAAQLAQAGESADGYAFAARSQLAEAMSTHGRQPPQELVLAAEHFALRALSVDPDHVEARLQLAIALSLKARPLSPGAALRSGYGEKARVLAESVLRDDPDSFYAHGFLAVWHVEVVRRGGPIGASMLGASLKTARHHYTQARVIRDDDAATHWQYARGLAALNPKKHRSVIDAALKRSIAATARTELEALMQVRATLLRDCLSAGSECNAKALAKTLL